MTKAFFSLSILLVLTAGLYGQQRQFTRQDTLRGSITPARVWWDLKYYHLDISVSPADQSISGFNTIVYSVLSSDSVMQIDLQQPMQIESVVQNGIYLTFTRDGSVFFVRMAEKQVPGETYSLVIKYSGQPHVAKNAPWDGGIKWSKDRNGNPFIGSACQGDGASMWWPCKDHMYDEPDSMLISVNVPDGLTDVSNGRLRRIDKHDDGSRTFHWFVSNPINNYGVNINIGDYVSFSEEFAGEKGNLDCEYWVLSDHLEKARTHFRQCPMMLSAFEYWFGPYPFYTDSYKLVETPYLGMEHQSSVTYGNGFRNGYRGRDLSGTGWGLKFDFIIVHESAHEWFANSITYNDIADMWVHESFANYAEALYVEYYYGKEAGSRYVIGSRRNILNDRPVTGVYGVNYAGSGDMYSKGGSMLHTLRQIVNDDEKWRSILRGLNRDFYHQTVDGKEIEQYLSDKTGLDLTPFFNQYLRDTRIPVLEYHISDKTLSYRWSNSVAGFDMPVRIFINGRPVLLKAVTEWKSMPVDEGETSVKADRNYYFTLSQTAG